MNAAATAGDAQRRPVAFDRQNVGALGVSGHSAPTGTVVSQRGGEQLEMHGGLLEAGQRDGQPEEKQRKTDDFCHLPAPEEPSRAPEEDGEASDGDARLHGAEG